MEKALEYFQRSLALYEEADNRRGISMVLNNLGIFHFEKGDLEKALEYYQRGLAVSEGVDSKTGNVAAFVAIGRVHHQRKGALGGTVL